MAGGMSRRLGGEEHTLGVDAHFQAGPEGRSRLVVPSPNNRRADMLSFRCGFVGVRGFLDVECEFLFAFGVLVFVNHLLLWLMKREEWCLRPVI